MADLFDEVGEDLRRDQMKRIWQRYGVVIIGAAVLVVVGVAGWRGYEAWRDGRAAEAGESFLAAVGTAEGGDHVAAAEALVALSSDAPAGYAVLARLRAATERAAAGETDAALAVFEEIAADGSAPGALRDAARLRAAMIAVDRENLDQIRSRVVPLDNPDNAFRHAARELVAVAAVKAEAWEEARKALATLTEDPELPGDIRQRAALMQDVVRSAVGEPAGTESES